MYQKKLIAIIIIFSMILGIVPKPMAKATSEKETELPFSIIETLKGVQNEKVVAIELDITDDNTEEIELGVPNVILLKQDLGNGSVKCYYVGTRGLIYDFILSQNDYESWLEKSFTHAGQIIFEPIQYKVEDDTNGTSYYYYHDIYWVRNSEGKFDFINIATCKYYEYSCDEMGEILPYNFISYKKDGKLGFLNKGGEKLTDAKYTHTNNYRWYDWIDKHTIIAWHGEKEDGTSCYDIIKNTKEVWEKRLWSINTRENVPIMWVQKESLGEEGVGIIDLSNGKEKWIDDQFDFSALSGETVIVTKFNDSARPETWLLTKDTSIPLTSKLGGDYCRLDYADTDVVYVEAYSEVLDSFTNRYKKEYTYQGVINAKGEKIYGTNSPEVWGWSVIRVDGNYIILYNAKDKTYKVVNMDGKDMLSFTSEEYLYSSEFSWYGERYLSYPEKGNGRWLVNLETGKKQHYDSQINLIKETNDDLYIWTQGKQEYQISSFEKGKEYIKWSEDMNDKINCAYCDDKGNVLIVIKDWEGKQYVLDENLENILVGEESVVTNQGYIICDNTVYNLNGEKVKTPVYLHTTEADSNGIYLVQKEESDGTTINYGTSGKFTYMDGKGNILSNYIYEEASEFSNGLAYVRRYGDDDISEAINHRGESIVKVVCDNRFEYDVFNKYNDVQQNHGWWARNNREMLKYTDGLILRNGNHYYLYDFSNVPREEFDTFPAGNDSTESAPAAKSYDFLTAYSSKDKEMTYTATGEIEVQFDENELKHSSKDYNHSIATLCSILSTLAYDIKDGYEKMLSKMDYEYDSMVLDEEGDSICYGLANKTILLDGKETDVVLVVLRGTYNMEWIDNFDPGTGKTHKGFQKGADTAYESLKKYITKKEIGEDGRQVKIIVTGHSRGAAVANLLGKEILDKGGSFLKDAGDLFDYSFATPNSTTLAERKNAKYDGIFSIVNPEDFVTKVMLSENWNYGRYGRTLVLPSSSTDSAAWYKKFLSGMRGYFKKYRPYDAYEPYPKGTNTVSGYVNLVAQTVPSVNRYYYQSLANPWDLSYIMKMGNTLKKLYTDFLGYNQCNNKVFEIVSYATLCDAVAGDYGFLGQSTAAYFIVNQAMDPRFAWAHLSETYLASMKALEAEDLYKNGKPVKRTVKKVMVNCPVDVSISNGEGEVVGEIVDNKIMTDIEGDSVNLSVIGDSKQFWISADEDCHVTLTGNDDGSMDYILSEEDADSGETQRILYKTVPIQSDQVYTSELLSDEDISEVKLQDEAGEVVDISEQLSEDELGRLSVTVEVEGVGMADSFNNLTYGDSVVLSAIADVNNSFLGWYDSDDNLVSTEREYPIVVTESQRYMAKFTNVIISPESINMEEKLVMSSGEVKYLETTVLPTNVTCSDVIYESSDENIVSVTEDGIVKAKSSGETTITAKSLMDDSIQCKCRITVNLTENNPTDPTDSSPTAFPEPTNKPTLVNPSVTKKPSSSYSSNSSKVKKPSKVTDLGLENKKKRKLVVSWLWQLDVSGFQIQYAQNKKFTKKKKNKFVGKWTSRKTITKLKKGKTYYVRVRAYKKSSGKKIYGKWSKIKKIKIKK